MPKGGSNIMFGDISHSISNKQNTSPLQEMAGKNAW